MNNDKDFYPYKEKVEFFKWQLAYVIDQIKMADNKINFLLAIYLVILGVAVSQIKKIIDILLNMSVYSIWKVAIGILCVLFLYCIFKFFYCFINTIKPRTSPKESLREKDYKSFIFWRDITDMGYQNFKNATLENRWGDLEKQVFINSCIAKDKFKNVNGAYKLFHPTLIIFLTLLSLIYLIGD